MPQTVALAAFIHPSTGEPVAAGSTIVLTEEDYAALRSNGAVAASAKEQKAHTTSDAEGNYTARTSRDDAGGRVADEPKDKHR